MVFSAHFAVGEVRTKRYNLKKSILTTLGSAPVVFRMSIIAIYWCVVRQFLFLILDSTQTMSLTKSTAPELTTLFPTRSPVPLDPQCSKVCDFYRFSMHRIDQESSFLFPASAVLDFCQLTFTSEFPSTISKEAF